MAAAPLALAAQIVGLALAPLGLTGASSGIAGLIIKYAIPPSSMPIPRRNTVVQVGIGLNNHVIADNPLEHSEGTSPMIVGFDESGGYVGMSKWSKKGHINNGGYHDIEVYHRKDREFTQTTYLQILAQSEPLCIAYILETWSDDSHRSWTGTEGPACGYKWGFSNIVLGHDQNGTVFKPYCTWVDRAHRRDIYPAALQIHMDDFYSTDMLSNHTDTSKLCKPPTMLFLDKHHYEFPHDFKFGNYPDFTDFEPLLYPGQFNAYSAPPELASLTRPPPSSSKSTSTSLPSASVSPATPSTLIKRDYLSAAPEHHSPHSVAEKRDLQKRDEALANLKGHHVITSPDSRHSARLACTLPGYLGPDVVSLHEQLFCDCETKTLWKLCQSRPNDIASQDDQPAGEDDEGCYHKDELSLVKAGNLHKRTYVRSEFWELNGDILVDGVVVNKK